MIEAVPEKMEIKHEVFADLDACTPGHAILASNTSGLSITEIGEITMRPDKVVGFHFFWPASRMRLIEIVEGDDTSPETVQVAANFAQAIRKVPVRCVECPGFVVNRILLSAASEIWRVQDETGAPVEEIDELLRAQAQMPMGPFRVADMSGLDTTVKVAQDMATPTATASTCIRGWRTSSPRAGSAPRAGRASMSTVDPPIAERFQLKAFVEACLVLEEGVAGVRDIDMGMMLGTGMVPGPFVRADLRGLDDVLAALERRRGRVGRALRAAGDPAPAGRPGAARREVRAGLLPVPAGRVRLRDGAREARHARRCGRGVARQPAGELAWRRR